jgi:hypothetical protein
MRPLQPQSQARFLSKVTRRVRKVEHRYRESAAGGKDPWIVIYDGATTAATNIWMPVPFSQLVYDPALVTLGDIFDVDTTDTGDIGNTRYRIKTIPKGVYYAELWTGWGQVTTDGASNYGYAVQDMFHTGAPNSLAASNEYSRASADWPKNPTVSDHEMVDNPFLFSAFTLFLNQTNWTWDPYAKQTTGSNRDLDGNRLYIEYRGYSDNASWTYDSV